MKQAYERFSASPIIAVMRDLDENKVYHVIEALIAGGINNIELTFGNESPVAIMEGAKKRFGNEVFLGAGTVLTVEEANEAIAAGAEFIFSPVFNEDVVKETVRQNVLSIPGCYSPTEIFEAYEAGAQCVKLFPATSVGENFIKDIKAPMPFINIIPTGGINKHNIANYMDAGAIAVGMGGSLLKKEYIESENYDALTQLAKELISLAKGG